MGQGAVAGTFTALWQIRRAIAQGLASVPFWREAEALARVLVSPVTGFARVLLRVFPFLKRLEWLLELQSLTRRHPVPLALALAYVTWRGIRLTGLGHIGTDPMIYPFVAVVSGFNPCLGFACGVLYGVGDLLQKLLRPDIFGATNSADPDYWPAMGGYAIAYSSLMAMGMLPGIMARVCRTLIGGTVSMALRPRAAANADGAGGAGDPAISLAGLVAAAAGGGLTGYVMMHDVAPLLEAPAFLLRPNPDLSCMAVEVRDHLKPGAARVLRAAGFGGLLTMLPPPPDGSGPPPSPPDESAPPRDPTRPAWSLANRPDEDHVWDPVKERWVGAETAREQRMRSEGYEWDPYREAWRPRVGDVERVSVPHETTPVVEYTPFSFQEPSTQRFEDRLGHLERQERNALDEYARLEAERDAARRSGDRWLEEQLSSRCDAARANVQSLQGEKNSLIARADREAGYDRRIQEVTVVEAGASAVQVVGEAAHEFVHPDMSFTAELLQRGIDARNRLNQEIESNQVLFGEQDRLIAEYRSLHERLRDATDPADRQQLLQDAQDLRGRISDVTREMERIHDARAHWEQEAARATLAGGSAAVDLASRGGMLLDSSRMVHRVVYPDAHVPWARPRSAVPDDAGDAVRAGEQVADGSAASPEAISRMRDNRLFRVDTRTGEVVELHGVDAVDVPVGPNDVKIIQNRYTGRLSTADAGERVTGDARAANRAHDAVGRYNASSESGGGSEVGGGGSAGAPPPPSGSGEGGAAPPPGGTGGGTPPDDSDLAAYARPHAGEPPSVVQQKVASAEQMAELLRHDEPLPDAGRPLPYSQEQWLQRDAALGMEPDIPKPNAQLLGIEPTPELAAMLKHDPDLQAIDSKIRDAFRRGGACFDEHGYENFEANLRAANVSNEDFNRWFEKVSTFKPSPAGPTVKR